MKTAWMMAAAAAGLFAGAASSTPGAADAAEIRVLSSNAIKETYLELAPQFERSSEHKLDTTWAGTVDIMKRLAAGETFDLVIMASDGIERLTRDGRIAAGSRVDLVKSGIGIAVRKGAPKPDMGSSDALKRALLAARSVGYSTGPSGVYLQGLFERLGIAEAVRGKTRQVAPGVPVGTIVASGEAEIGFQQVSELLHVEGIDYLGPLPADVQHVTVFSAGVHAGARHGEAAKELVRFLTGPAAAPVMRKNGLDPA
jgi:molybdate transport system substrate-binding protein